MRILIKRCTLIITSYFIFSHVFTFAGQIYIPVGQAHTKKSVLAIQETKLPSQVTESLQTFQQAVRTTLIHDLEFTNLFSFQSTPAFIEKTASGLTLDSFKLTDWSTIGTEFLIKAGAAFEENNIAYELHLFDVVGAKQILGKKYIAQPEAPQILAHTIANEMIETLTGREGIFFTKIAMVCDKSGHKEIWIMDIDGSNAHQLTHHDTLALAPAWSMDNKKLAYSLEAKHRRNIKNIDLYEYDFSTKKTILLSNRQGLNSGANYSPDRAHIALTMSFLKDQASSLGNPPRIYLLNPLTSEVTPLTHSFGFEVDPVFSLDGKKIAFISTRSGKSMVYTMDTTGSNVTRLTYAGQYNATPDWSPTDNKLVFAGYLEDHFDLFLINSDGTKLERLTKNEGNNEDPNFSPDGNFILFNRRVGNGKKHIFTISVDGLNTRQLTDDNLGNCEAPKWSHAQKWPGA